MTSARQQNAWSWMRRFVASLALMAMASLALHGVAEAAIHDHSAMAADASPAISGHAASAPMHAAPAATDTDQAQADQTGPEIGDQPTPASSLLAGPCCCCGCCVHVVTPASLQIARAMAAPMALAPPRVESGAGVTASNLKRPPRTASIA